MGAIITQPKPSVAGEFSHSQAPGTNEDSSPTDLTSVVTKSEASPKAEAVAEPNQSTKQDTVAITSPDNADRAGDLSENANQSQTTQEDREAENTTEQKLDRLRAQMKSYKALYDAGQPLPEGTDDDFYPGYVKANSKYKTQIVDWMVEYSVPELYLKTLESTTYTTWLVEESMRVTPSTALKNLYFHIDNSKILAERLLSSGFLNYAAKTLTDPRYLDNNKDKQVVSSVILRIIFILKNCVKLVPDHPAYKQVDLTQVLKKYISSDFKFSALTILLAVASEEECTALVETELEEIRAKMESYKQLYDAGDSLPAGTVYKLCPFYLMKNPVYLAKAVPWMMEYNIPELYKRTLDEMTSTAIRTDKGVFTTCYTVLFYFWSMSAVSKVVVEKLIELKCIEYYVDVLTDPLFTQNQHEPRSQRVLRACLDTINMCVREVPGHFIYKELKLNEVMKPYLASDNMVLRAIAIMIYSSVIGEDESKQLDDAGCIPYIVDGIDAAINTADRGFHVTGVIFEMKDLLECVNRIAANDTNKVKLVDAGLLPHLVKSLQTGNEKEQEITAKLTWTLCFDKNIRERVINEPSLVKELEHLSKSSSQVVQKAAKGALWKISGEEKHQQQAQQQTFENKHIFISYQWDNQELILQLNQRLKADGYKTWIDVEQMGGSTLDAMAGAVENAALVLICASEKYKLSPNCRTEGEYTFQRRKTFVPLMMQRRYRADGWLGMLMGAKLYINFDGKYEFDEAYQMLMKEMTPILKVNPDRDSTDGAAVLPQVASVSHTAFPVSQMTSQMTSQPAAIIDPSVVTWSHQQVLEWAAKHNLTQHSAKFDSLLEGMDGRHLVMFCEMEMKAPEFFYKLMRKQCKLDMMAFMSLKLAMNNLQQ